MKKKLLFTSVIICIMTVLIIKIAGTSVVLGKETEQNLGEVSTIASKETRVGNSIKTNPKWQEISKVELTEDSSFVLKYSEQISIKNNKNFKVSGKLLTFNPSKIGDKAEAYITNVGEYGVSIVNMKITVESLKGKGANVSLSKDSFMTWLLNGDESVKISYEYFNVLDQPMTVSGINYFEGVNKAKNIDFKDDEISKIFSISDTNILYEPSDIAGFTSYSSKLSGFGAGQVMGVAYENRKSLEIGITNNDPDTSQVLYSAEAPIKFLDSPLISTHPEWKNSEKESIPKKNYFTMYYNNKIKVSKKSGEVTINDATNGKIVEFNSSNPSSILIENVSFYEGQWISLSVKVSGKSSGSSSVLSRLSVTNSSFLRWALQGNVMLNTEYQFLNQKGEPISISGYWTFKNMNKAKNLSLSNSFIKAIYSPKETDIRYGVFGDNTEFSSKIAGSDVAKEMTITFDDVSSFNFSIRNNDPDESAVNYDSSSLVPVEIPDFIPENKVYDTVTEDEKFFTSFYQMVPYEPDRGRKDILTWKIKIPDYIQKSNTVNVFNEAGEDKSDLFNINNENDELTIQVKDLKDKKFYNHLYEFRINWQINYNDPIDVNLLNKQGYLNLVSLTELHVDQTPVRTNKDITGVNFNSNTEIKYQNTEGEELKHTTLRSFLTLKADNLENLVQEKISAYKYKETSMNLIDYQYRNTNSTEVITYEKILAPIISMNDAEKIHYVNIKNNVLDLNGITKLDSMSNYEVHLTYNGKDEIIQSSKIGEKGNNAWKIDPDYRMTGLTAGKNYEAEVYAKDEFSNISNKITFRIYVEGFLELTEVPTSIDYEQQTIPTKQQVVDRANSYKIKISDLRGPNKKFKLELKLNEYLTGKDYHQVMKQGIVYTDEKGITNKLVKDSSIIVASGDTGNENKETEVTYEYDKNSGVLVNLSPDMKKDTYSASLTWVLVDAP
ncbi:hypothetical protein DOK67_0001837 [Enterococcus sp. DIV0212c]|uniref:hypothetical protein n=1 Tax=Enterococcus sp. DIV0212c TaxID=2230867 RepID=UPI001A9AD329|nr:hypothetical protein [Enterococcus sp. DIV0212c]MBO1352474.1 hypothetical protein [Enterococcus sp. DIV0212c]